jgi:excinuclease ABC subunit C
MSEITFDYKSVLPQLPEEPGVYRYFDETGEIIYVGKAKNLKNRVSSYFYNFNRHDRKTSTRHIIETQARAIMCFKSCLRQHAP